MSIQLLRLLVNPRREVDPILPIKLLFLLLHGVFVVFRDLPVDYVVFLLRRDPLSVLRLESS